LLGGGCSATGSVVVVKSLVGLRVVRLVQRECCAVVVVGGVGLGGLGEMFLVFENVLVGTWVVRWFMVDRRHFGVLR
jgi:hypothetical protein